MRVTWSQFAEAAQRMEPGIEPEVVRARFDAVASQDGDVDSLSDKDLAVLSGAPRMAKSAWPDQRLPVFALRARPASLAGVNVRAVFATVQLLQDEQKALARRIQDESITTLLSFAAGQPQRLRLLDRCDLCGLVDRLCKEAPTASFRMASILADAIACAARDPRLDPEHKDRVLSDSCAALLRLPARDVKFAFTRYSPQTLSLLPPAQRQQVQAVIASVPVSMFGENAG